MTERECYFCGEWADGRHHVIPKTVVKVMNWRAKKYGRLGQFKVPMCRRCEERYHMLVAPLVRIICELRYPTLSFDLFLDLERVLDAVGEITGEEVEEEKPDE